MKGVGLLLIVALCAGVNTVLGYYHRVRPCAAPSRFHADFALELDERKYVSGSGHRYYDGVGRREYLVTELYGGGATSVTAVLTLYNQSAVYTVDGRTGKCARSRFTGRRDGGSIPSNAKFSGEFVLGSLQIQYGGMRVQRWRWNETTTSGSRVNYESIVSENGCLPIVVEADRSFVGAYRATFFNYTMGIRDLRVFDVPKSCRTSDTLRFRNYRSQWNEYL